MDLIDQTKNQGRQRRTILKETWLQINEKRKVASMQLQTQWREFFKFNGNPSLNEANNLFNKFTWKQQLQQLELCEDL